MTIYKILAAPAVIAVAVVGLTLAPTNAATQAPAKNCSFQQSELPRTPDAVEHWYAGCDTSGATADTASLPRSADAAEAWLA